MALCDSSLENFSKSLSQLDKIDQSFEGKYWIINNLTFETKRLLKQKEDNAKEIERYRIETVNTKINALKTTSSSEKYGDEFNRIVCTRADSLDISLPKAELIVKTEIENSITELNIKEYIFISLSERKVNQLKRLLQKNFQKFDDPDKALKLTSIQYEIDKIKTDNIWGSNKFEKIILNGIKGECVNLITMLCLINQFDYNGEYSSISNLDAYLDNPKLEAIPLIINEMLLLPNFLDFYGIKSNLTIYIADTDYTEIGEFGPVNNKNVRNIQDYIKNVQDYLGNIQNVAVFSVSQITNNNRLYDSVKKDITEKVKNFKDYDFAREWYQKFEDDVERRFESQTKRKIFAQDEIRQKTLELTRSIWSCNAAQGVVFGTLDPNTILISTERRERDINYTIDKRSRENFPPVLYVLKAAENWNRKLVQKET
ncbi:MAG: hypothetical protein Q8Q30_02160 [Candidatus Woesebacteria bacterium]|nr:hypothetical protein [Candidatus Woesebacteria bacterium]